MIPARREPPARCLGACLAAARAVGAGSLCVLVVNAADDPDDQISGAALLETLETRAPARWRGAGLSLHALAGCSLLAVDACRGAWRFEPRAGVGHARKLGADLVVALEQRGAVRGGWIHNTDADARLPAGHGERVHVAGKLVRSAGAATVTPEVAPVVATVAPFWHVPGGDPATDAATAAYELELRYYVAGLRSAGSPWAFHTIGSTISVRSSAYVAVRGFPRREAGEDFYLLGKLGKLGSVVSLEGARVEIVARRSSRVPFGTGPAVEALLAGRPAQVYDPRVFDVLAAVERALGSLSAGQGLAEFRALAAGEALSELTRCAASLETCVASYPRAQLARRVRERFDAFTTLKLIHELTRTRWPKLAWDEALARAHFIDFGPQLERDEQRSRLAQGEHGVGGLGAATAGG